MATLVALAIRREVARGEEGLQEVLKSVPILHPSKSAIDYWMAINRTLVDSLGPDTDLWKAEKIASQESLAVTKRESLRYLTAEKDKLLDLSHKEALRELVRMSGFNSRIQQVERIQHGPLLGELG